MNFNKFSEIRHVALLRRYYCHKINDNRVSDFPCTYSSKEIEQYWNNIWHKHKYFHRNETTATLKMILPPPNVTGVLHLGHALTVTIQDVLARWHKMKGASVLWIPGLDHAGIATQIAVEKYLLATKNVTRHDLGREKFLDYVEQWKAEKGQQINAQLKNLGTTLDWSKEYFTMSKEQSNAVMEAFITLFERNLLYRKNDLVNWCPALRSTISDIEIEFLEINTKTDLSVPGYNRKISFGEMADVIYKLKDSQEEIVVSTTRVESMPGDVAIAVHPNDSRYSRYIGRQVWHPIREIYIPVIQDFAVKPEFGTGAVKITPAHDRLDLDIARRHNLEFVEVIGEDGRMTKKTKTFSGLLRFEARIHILDQLANCGALKQIKDHPMSIPICSRSGDVIEYLMKEQWFLKMKIMAERVINAVKNKKMKIEPNRYEELWFEKLNNIKDWCVSRQLWWGHPIPTYSIIKNGEKQWVAARSYNQARDLFEKRYGRDFTDLEQDNDVLDTWFSASLLPLTVMGWPDIIYSKYYPLDLMETGHDILFHWVARMAMLSTELVGALPFNEILLHGILCDAQGKKMSKSRGNVILPEYVIYGITRNDLDAKAQENFKIGILNKTEFKRTIAINAKIYPEGIFSCGVDALRLTLCAHNIKNDKMSFNVIECRTNKFFCNKIWQACRYVLLVTDEFEVDMPDCLSTVDRWILSRLTMMVSNVNKDFENRNFHKITAAFKQFFYYEFCDFFLEATKPALQSYDRNLTQSHQFTLIKSVEVSLRIIAPVMPYLSEELYSRLGKKLSAFQTIPSIMVAKYPTEKEISYRDEKLEKKFDEIIKMVLNIRNIVMHVNKKSILELHLVFNDNHTIELYTDNINFISAATKIRNIKIFSANNYVIHDDSVCINETECCLYYLFRNNEEVTQIKKTIQSKRFQMERSLEKLFKKMSQSYNTVYNEVDKMKNEKRIKKLQQELQKYPKFL